MTNPKKRSISNVLLILWLLLTAALGTYIFVLQGKGRPANVAGVSSKESVKANGGIVQMPANLPEYLTLSEFKEFLNGDLGIVADARPEVFYRTGHVPTAVSLPRDDFDAAYPKLKEKLTLQLSTPIVIYCSSSSCQDSDLVRVKLHELGHTNVGVFKGGWSEWTASDEHEGN